MIRLRPVRAATSLAKRAWVRAFSDEGATHDSLGRLTIGGRRVLLQEVELSGAPIDDGTYAAVSGERRDVLYILRLDDVYRPSPESVCACCSVAKYVTKKALLVLKRDAFQEVA
jgi:hypothetical protein